MNPYINREIACSMLVSSCSNVLSTITILYNYVRVYVVMELGSSVLCSDTHRTLHGCCL